MFALIAPILSLIGSFVPSVKDYLNYKQQAVQYDRDYKLALLQSQVATAQAQIQSDSQDLKSRLEATSQDFKQNTFYFLCVPTLFTMFVPSKAAELWHNFSLMPEMFQYLFYGVYSSIWGIPMAKSGQAFLESRREYKLEKAKIDKKIVFDTLKKAGIFKGTQSEVEVIDRALDSAVQ